MIRLIFLFIVIFIICACYDELKSTKKAENSKNHKTKHNVDVQNSIISDELDVVIDSTMFCLNKSDIIKLSSDLIDALKRCEKWEKMVRQHGCSEGYVNAFFTYKDRFRLQTIYKNDKPCILLTTTENQIAIFDNVKEITSTFNEMFEQIKFNNVLCQK